MDTYPAHPILLVDDEERILEGARLALRSHGIHRVETCGDSTRAQALIAERPWSAIVLDLSMPGVSGQALLAQAAHDRPEVPVIVLTGHNEAETAVACLKQGAFDYLVKPVDDTRFAASVSRAIEHGELLRENNALKSQLLNAGLEHPEAFADLVTADPALLSVLKYAETISRTPAPVLIHGETGVGKELLARAVHTASGRQGKFVPVNAAGLDDTMFSDTLFGHLKGAFTGATSARPGLIERAAGGTLFLDEIGDLPAASQVKLLRLLQEREYYPLGADLPKASTARVIVATHRDLRALAESGVFRKDLFFRLRTHEIHLSPLRERLDDIPLLLEHFVRESAATLQKKAPSYPVELPILLGAYHYPGNVRELQAMIFDAVSRHGGGMLPMDSFRERINVEAAESFNEEFDPGDGGPVTSLRIEESDAVGFPTLEVAEEYLMQQALIRAKGNQGVAAHLLGISRTALNKRLKKAERKKGM